MSPQIFDIKIVTNHAMTISFFLVHNSLCSQSCPTKVLFSFRLILPFLFFLSVFEVQLKICQIFITHYLQRYVTKMYVDTIYNMNLWSGI